MTGTELVVEIRDVLVEATAVYWEDARLLTWMNLCYKDLWRAICDNYQDYFFAVDETVSAAANATTLSGVPTNVAKVTLIEPKVRSSYPNMNFFPRAYDSDDMRAARAQDAVDPSQCGRVFYAITGAGAPIGAPTIHFAPKFTSAVPLRMAYTPTTPVTILTDANPVPGESDAAVIAYVIAHALGKEREDRKPDPDWLAKYATEKQNMLTFLSPRQNDEPDVAEAFFEIWTNGD